MKYLISPSADEALQALNESLSSIRRRMVTIVGCCKVDYTGRAKSFLDYGDRLVIVKADGTVMVHGNEKREPVNWQPPGTSVKYMVEEGLIIEARRASPTETMRIHFKSIQALSIFTLNDGAEINIVGEEADIVDRIESDPSIIEEGLRVVRREKATSSGFIDLLCEDRNGVTVIVEVKRTSISPNAVYQMEAYLADFKKKNDKAIVRGILCAPRVSEMARTLIAEKGLEYRQIGYEFELKDKKQASLDSFK
ncbi:putative nuclease of the RecB family [Methanocella conradii HZ254]|uniref:Endonuclease NucS n=1 Tax=Methanocella conradii (strain DSM 24694 / JCM 17849 / CGMCC 1.5162 / HZ254) TaxID=1041930 RepID=H8IAM0_METCZ|nr:endonuclease NucS [Methanocella conradii]AFD00117.1 putative nuclease of the RecB family [Methanocella conradii HZ254]